MLRTQRLASARALALGLFTVSIAACGHSPEPAQNGDDGLGDLGVDQSELGAPLASCSTAGSSGFSSMTQTLTLNLTGGPSSVMLSAYGGGVVVNGWACVNSSGANLTLSGQAATTVKKIVINGDNAVAEKVILDLLPGSFGSTIFSGAANTGIQVDLGTGAGDTFMLRGTNNVDKVTMGNGNSDVFVDLNGDNKADVRVINTENYSVTLLGGDDIFTAAGGAVNATTLASGVTTLTAMTSAITVFGGDGKDTIQGGNGNDTLNGGNGDDTFKTVSGGSADGADTYIGGPGNDTVDYTGRTANLTVDIGPKWANVVGTVDLTTLTYPTGLDMTSFDATVDGAMSATTVTFSSPADAAAVVSQINAALGATLAFLDPGNHLVIHAGPNGLASSLVIASGGTALAVLGVASGTYLGTDGDDGQSGEHDDVTYTVENVLGGSGNDHLTGSDQVNTLNGGGGDDVLTGVTNASCPMAGGDQLVGGAGNDTFLMGVYANCGVTVTGGAGTDTVDYSARTHDLTVTLDGTANDGETNEKGNINKADVEILLGGSGNDHLTGGMGNDEIHGGPGNDIISGGAGNDVLVGDTGNDTINGDADDDTILEGGSDALYSPALASGAGDDVINGGAGNDKVSYAGRTADLTITLCVNAAVQGPPTGMSLGAECTDSDGDPAMGVAENDNLVNVEWLVGGDGNDTLTGSTADEIIEGGIGNDVIHGGDGNDSLYGDAGNDQLFGENGDDYLEGGAGNDALDGGNGDGDVCVGDASDLTAQANCEL